MKTDRRKDARGLGQVVWHDLMTTDLEASKRFYTALLGWKAKDVDLGGMGTWSRLSSGKAAVARFVPLDAGMGLPSHWVSYVSVEDVDAACERAADLGGECCYPAFDDPELGRFAMLQDAAKGLTKPLEPARDLPFAAKPGRLVWDRLLAKKPARRFYEGLYGWKLVHGKLGRDGADVAGVGPGVEGPLSSAWVPHALVASLDASVDLARKLGGTVVRGPEEVPGVGRVAIVRDPAGALLGLLADPELRWPGGFEAKPKARAKARKTPAGDFSVREYFATIADRLDLEKAKRLEGVVQYELSGEGGGSWHLVFAGGKLECREGVHAKPDVTLALAAADYLDLLKGKMTGPQAVSSGKLKLTGSFALALALARIRRPLA